MRLLAFLVALLTAAPAAAEITFPIRLTDYWPNTAAMDAGWRLEAEGCPTCLGRFVRTGLATFAWLETPTGCLQDHYVVTAYDQVPLGRDDPRIVGGIFMTHTISTCPGDQRALWYAPWRWIGPPLWEPGFGTLAIPVHTHTVYTRTDSSFISVGVVKEQTRWLDYDPGDADGVRLVSVERSDEYGGENDRDVFGMFEYWIGDVPFCDGSPGSAPGWR